MSGGQLTKLGDIRAYLTGGHATFTLVSKKTGDRKTFRVRDAEKDSRDKPSRSFVNSSRFFVDLLVGPQNTDDYQYLAFVWEDLAAAYDSDTVRPLRLKPNKEHWGEEAYRVFEWLVNRLNVTRNVQGDLKENELFNAQAEFWHLGKCARCGRDLTTPESIASGIGPVCAGKDS